MSKLEHRQYHSVFRNSKFSISKNPRSENPEIFNPEIPGFLSHTIATSGGQLELFGAILNNPQIFLLKRFLTQSFFNTNS